MYARRVTQLRQAANQARPSLESLDDLLHDAALEHLNDSCDWTPLGCTLLKWEAALRASRPNFLRLLKECGVPSLTERQTLSNVLARARREGRLPSEAGCRPVAHVRASTEGTHVLVRLDVTRLHTGYVSTCCVVVAISSKLAPAAQLMMLGGSIPALQLALNAYPPRVGFEQEVSAEASRLLVLGSRFGTAAAMDCLLRWLHEGWEAIDLDPSQNTTALVPMQTPLSGKIQPWAERADRPLDLQVVFTVLIEAKGSRGRFSGKDVDVQNHSVLEMVIKGWVEGCSTEQWKVLMAFACHKADTPIVIRLMGVTHGEKAKKTEPALRPDVEEATRYAESAVAKARGLYAVLSRRHALDTEQRRQGAVGLTAPERHQLETRIKYARARLAQLGQPAPTPIS